MFELPHRQWFSTTLTFQAGPVVEECTFMESVNLWHDECFAPLHLFLVVGSLGFKPSCHVAVQQNLGMIGPRRLRPNVRISACPIHGDAAFLRTFAFLSCCCILGPYCDLPNSALWCPCESDVLWVPCFLGGGSWWLWIGDISPMQRQVFHLQVISSIEYQRGESWNYRIPQVIPMPLGVKTRVKLVKWEKVMADFFVT